MQDDKTSSAASAGFSILSSAFLPEATVTPRVPGVVNVDPAPMPAASDVVGSGSVPSASSSASEKDGPYLPISALPTLGAHHGVRFDFNHGARVFVPNLTTAGEEWRVVLTDAVTGNVLFNARLAGGTVASTKKFYVPFGIEVWRHKADGTAEEVLKHTLDLRGHKVLVQIPVGTLGDTLAWLPSVRRLALETGAHVTCTVADVILPVVEGANPDITLVGHDAARGIKDFTADFYATYHLGLFFTDQECTRQPTDFRHVGLHRTAAYILGVDPWDEEPPGLVIPDGDTPPIEGPYVVIATQASSQCKYWNNPAGWRDVITFLKSAGYRVICIDQRPYHGTGYTYNHIPHGAEDETGDRPLGERARWIKHAAFFVGLSSGLAWLAYATRTPVVIISGFTHPDNEFRTPYRVINWHTCNSCWNDPAHQFDHKDFFWCPRHAGTERQFECTRLITGPQVIHAIRKLMRDHALPGAEAQIPA